MFKKKSKGLSLLMIFCLLFTYSGVTAFAGISKADMKQWQIENQLTGEDISGKEGGNYELDADHSIVGDPVDANITTEDGLIEISKTIMPAGIEDEFDITLKVTTAYQLEKLEIPADTAVVLAIDISTSMNGALNGSNTSNDSLRRVTYAKNAAKIFVDKYVAGNDGAERWISLVKFGTNADLVMQSGQAWTNAAVSTAPAISAINSLNASATNYTNIEGALQLARNILTDGQKPGGTIEGVKNIFVVLLTDGVPTAYPTSRGAISATQITGTRNSNSPTDGSFAEAYQNVPTVANQIKTGDPGKREPATLYTISFAITNEMVGNGTTKPKIPAHQWLRDEVASNKMSFPAENLNELDLSFGEIIKNIRETLSQAFTVTDPMGQFIIYDTENNGGDVYNDMDQLVWHYTSPESGKPGFITWNVRFDDYVDTYEDAEGTRYVYERTYRVKLDTKADGFIGDTYYPANEKTTLIYTLVRTENDKIISDGKLYNLDYTIPVVKGFKKYNVYYQYYYDNGTSYFDEYQVADYDLYEGEGYDASEVVLSMLLVGEKTYYFTSETNTDNRGNTAWTLTDARGNGYSIGKIGTGTDAKDVYIDIYYERDTIPSLGLPKVVKWPRDQKLPSEYTFEFKLMDGDEVVARLTLTQDDFKDSQVSIHGNSKVMSTSAAFVWESGVKFHDLWDTQLTLTETLLTVSNDVIGTWSSDYENGLAYVMYDENGVKSYIQENNGVVVNQFKQTPQPADILVKKSFSIDSEDMGNFLAYAENYAELICGEEEHQHDTNINCGTELACGQEEHEHYILEDEEEGDIEICPTEEDGGVCPGIHEHKEGLLEDDGCYDYICGLEEHSHSNDYCYGLIFTFNLTDDSGDVIDGPKDLLLTINDIKSLAGGGSKEITFTVPVKSLPTKADGLKAFIVKEDAGSNVQGYEGWTVTEKTVYVDYLGRAYYGRGNQYAAIKNQYNQLESPAVEFSKSLFDNRADGALTTSTFDFEFEIFEIADVVDRGTKVGATTLSVADGYGAVSLTEDKPDGAFLSRYAGKDVMLAVREKAGTNSDVSYDKNALIIEIVSGKVVDKYMVDQNGDKVGSDVKGFVNTYHETYPAAITISKSTNDPDKEYDFKFEITVTEEGSTPVVNTVTIEKAGKTKSTTFDLPDNFSGSVVVKELKSINGSTGEDVIKGWRFDDIQYTFEFTDGVGYTSNPEVAAFDNSYYGPKVDLTKKSNPADGSRINDGDLVTYEVTVKNTSYNENLTEITITDTKLAMVSGGAIEVLIQQPGEDVRVLEKDVDYIYTTDGEKGAIKLIIEEALQIDGKLIIQYSIQWMGTGEYKNEASVTAKGSDSGWEVRDGDSVSVNVPGSSGNGGGGGGSGGRDRNQTPTPDTNIPEPEVPLGRPEDVQPPEIIVPEEDVPLSDIPQTGLDNDAAFDLTILGFSLAALIVMFGRRKDNQQ